MSKKPFSFSNDDWNGFECKEYVALAKKGMHVPCTEGSYTLYNALLHFHLKKNDSSLAFGNQI